MIESLHRLGSGGILWGLVLGSHCGLLMLVCVEAGAQVSDWRPAKLRIDT